MSENISQFEKWFKSQFGHTPTDIRPQHKILQDLIETKKKVAELERELFEQRRISNSWEAALYCKNAAEKKFEF